MAKVGHRRPPRRRKAAEDSRHTKKLLIIDDEISLLESLSELLSTANRQVTIAATAQEGIDKAAKEDFDLVLTDLGMPGMNGWEVAERIKASSPSTSVGIMTGWDVAKPAASALGGNIDFVLRKPFDPREVLAHLD
ncbi:MAG: response regulator [Pseudomonadota bacterium]